MPIKPTYAPLEDPNDVEYFVIYQEIPGEPFRVLTEVNDLETACFLADNLNRA